MWSGPRGGSARRRLPQSARSRQRLSPLSQPGAPPCGAREASVARREWRSRRYSRIQRPPLRNPRSQCRDWWSPRTCGRQEANQAWHASQARSALAAAQCDRGAQTLGHDDGSRPSHEGQSSVDGIRVELARAHRMPAALAARMPMRLSSTTTQRAGSTPSSRAACERAVGVASVVRRWRVRR